MTRVLDSPEEFADAAIDGFVAANRQYVARVDGGVVRSTETPDGHVALVIGGGSGHYPAFAGLVGAGLANGAACGNIFASPAASQVYRVAKASSRGGGVLLSYGNYAGDVLNFGQAQDRLNAEGIQTRTVLATDDIASASVDELDKRRGIAGDLTVFKIAGASAERGDTLDEVERLAMKANAHTRSIGIAYGSPTLPGADEPLFSVPDGQFSLGLGIHGEPGISEHDSLPAADLAELLVETLLKERADAASTRVVPILNGLGTVKYEELFVLYRHIERRLTAAGLEIVEPEVGELVTSLDMAGLSLTLLWLDAELEELWAAPADTPAYRKGTAARRASIDDAELEAALAVETEPATDDQVRAGEVAARVIDVIRATVERNEKEFGRIDAIAGDGDHGIGMRRGAEAAAASARESVRQHRGIEQLLVLAGEAWSEKAGGTSGALWAAALTAVGHRLAQHPTAQTLTAQTLTAQTVAIADAARAALDAIQGLGGAVVGDKTLVDVLVPYVDDLTAHAKRGTGVLDALAAAAVTAVAAAESTAELRPKKGRARPLAEKSIGHPDAGAVSLSLIVTDIAKDLSR